MKLKIGSMIVCAICLVIIFSSMPLIFAQDQAWGTCVVDAYGTEVDDEVEAGILRFTAAAPPTGSNIANIIYVVDENTGENFTIILAEGDQVSMNYQYPIYKEINAGTEADHYTIYYEGEATFVSVNSEPIPEFSSVIIAPLFLIGTVLAIVYRRKRTSLTNS
ncbi:MAG: hypothetical protein P8X97_07250 [Candidatus Bathyarchaeota archaeon]